MAQPLFNNKNFLLLWSSIALSQVGSFFTMVALPWLAMAMTHDDPVVVATLLAALSLPHALFTLLGGVLADRLSPLKTLVFSRLLFAGVMIAMSAGVYFQMAPLWSLYCFAVALGTLGAVAVPSAQALLPSLVGKQDQLTLANGIVIGSIQLAQVVGPMAAGWLIWYLRYSREIPVSTVDFQGAAVAFAADAMAVLLAGLLLLFISAPSAQTCHDKVSVMLRNCLLFCWYDRGIRFVITYLLVVSLFLHGPMLAMLPIFTKSVLGLSAGSYGTLYAMMGLGTILGAGLAAVLRPSQSTLGALVLGCDLLTGLCLYWLAQCERAYTAVIFIFMMGCCSGLIMVAGTTWFHKRTPADYMGRVMGVLMFSVLGLVPVSSTIAGFAVRYTSVPSVMEYAGIAIFTVALIGILLPSVRNMGDLPLFDVKKYLNSQA